MHYDKQNPEMYLLDHESIQYEADLRTVRYLRDFNLENNWVDEESLAQYAYQTNNPDVTHMMDLDDFVRVATEEPNALLEVKKDPATGKHFYRLKRIIFNTYKMSPLYKQKLKAFEEAEIPSNESAVAALKGWIAETGLKSMPKQTAEVSRQERLKELQKQKPLSRKLADL